MTDTPRPMLAVNVNEVLALRLQPGDTLVLRAADGMKLSPPQRINATEALEQLIAGMGLAGKVKALVLDGGWDLKVIRPEGEA